MGTNYEAEADPTCDNPAHTKSLHIGKSSMGWKFSFRAYDDLGLTSWAAWRTYLDGRVIRDEYGDTLTLEEFTDRVTNRHTPDGEEGPWSHANPSEGCKARGFGGRWYPPRLDEDGRYDSYEDPEGFDFSRYEFR